MAPFEVCFTIDSELPIGPVTVLDVGSVGGERAVLTGTSSTSLRWFINSTGQDRPLAGPAALDVVAVNRLQQAATDVFVLGQDGSIRVHVDGSETGVIIAPAATVRSGLAVDVVGTQVNVVTVRASLIERFVLRSDGNVETSTSIDGARGAFVALLDPDEDDMLDIVVGGAQFVAAVALDSFLAVRDFSDPVQSQIVDCPAACEMTGMALGEIFDADAEDLAVIVPGAIGGDVHLFLGGGSINFFSSPVTVPATGVTDVAFGEANDDSRNDLVVTANCVSYVFPGVPLGFGPNSGSPLGEPVKLPDVDGHCPTLVSVADVDGDGVSEIVTGSTTDEHVVIYRRNP